MKSINLPNYTLSSKLCPEIVESTKIIFNTVSCFSLCLRCILLSLGNYLVFVIFRYAIFLVHVIKRWHKILQSKKKKRKRENALNIFYVSIAACACLPVNKCIKFHEFQILRLLFTTIAANQVWIEIISSQKQYRKS